MRCQRLNFILSIFGLGEFTPYLFLCAHGIVYFTLYSNDPTDSILCCLEDLEFNHGFYQGIITNGSLISTPRENLLLHLLCVLPNVTPLAALSQSSFRFTNAFAWSHLMIYLSAWQISSTSQAC